VKEKYLDLIQLSCHLEKEESPTRIFSNGYSSFLDKYSNAEVSAYCVSKFGMIGLTESLACGEEVYQLVIPSIRFVNNKHYSLKGSYYRHSACVTGRCLYSSEMKREEHLNIWEVNLKIH
jgi:hypothetical protein